MNLKLYRKDLIKLLKKELESYGSQVRVSKETGLSISTLSRLKKGKTEADFDMLCILSDYFTKKGVY